jgi:uncharacterized membrane protein
MIVMIAGLVLFLGIHLVPTAPALRARLVGRMGENAYRGVFSLVSVTGLVLMVVGYRMAPDGAQLFTPMAPARAAAPIVVTLAFVLLASANMRTHLRRSVRHPMLIGVILWAGVHLLANGETTGTVLFASILAWASIDLVSAMRRGEGTTFVPSWTHDAIAISAGLALAWTTLRYHAVFFNTPPVA